MNGFAPLLAVLALSQAEPDAPAPAAAEATESARPTDRATTATPSSAPPAAAPPAAAPPAAASPASPSPPRAPPRAPRTAPPSEPERTQVARAALAFLDALVASDADALAGASAERFSFDGEVRTGRDAVRRAWRELLARRDAPRAALLDLELLPAADAVARLGPPPARVAPLAARGAWIGIADVSGRAVILFVSRDGARWAVAGIHD